MYQLDEDDTPFLERSPSSTVLLIADPLHLSYIPRGNSKLLKINPGKHRIRNQCFGNKVTLVVKQLMWNLVLLACSRGLSFGFCNTLTSCAYVIFSTLQLRKLRNRIKFSSQGTYSSKYLNSKPRSCNPIFSHLFISPIVSQGLDLEDFLSYNRSVDLDSMEIKTQENHIFLSS